MELEADAGDAAARDLVGGERQAVFVGEMEGAVSFRSLFQSGDESFHLDVDDLLFASEADTDDYEGHVGNSEMVFGAFPQAELNGAVLAEVMKTDSNGVPVEWGFIKVVSEDIGDIRANLISANLDSTRHKHHYNEIPTSDVAFELNVVCDFHMAKLSSLEVWMRLKGVVIKFEKRKVHNFMGNNHKVMDHIKCVKDAINRLYSYC